MNCACERQTRRRSTSPLAPRIPHVADPSAEREPFVRESPAQALGEQVRRLHHRAFTQPRARKRCAPPRALRSSAESPKV